MQTKTKIIIGLMGKPGAGKDTFIKILEKLCPNQTIVNLRFSDILGEICDYLGIRKNRDGLSLVARMMKDKIAPDALAQAMKKKLLDTEAGMICINGVRWVADVDLLESINGHLVFIDTTETNRYPRVIARGEKPGETELTPEEFHTQEQTENDLTMDTLRHHAEIIIDNNGSRDELEKQIVDWLTTIKI